LFCCLQELRCLSNRDLPSGDFGQNFFFRHGGLRVSRSWDYLSHLLDGFRVSLFPVLLMLQAIYGLRAGKSVACATPDIGRLTPPGGLLGRLPRPPLWLPGHEFPIPNDDDTLAAASLGHRDWFWIREVRGCGCTAADEDDAVTGLGLRHAQSPFG
jgi:hypothetical protein